ncbi:MAG: cobalamin-dependent protein, partial [Clostridia bacterium]|nr:cobalamin-dependent protein [Clostridia bacterium]
MKIVLTTLNAKYVHINLAIRTIAKHCSEFSPIIKEYTINDNIDSIIASLHMQKADVIAFSCYIWNIEKVLYICRCLKEVNPKIKIILGGHEVSYDAEEIMRDNPWVDYIISGEGEKAVKALLGAIKNSSPLENVPSLTYRKDGKILCTPLIKPSDINEYEFPYDETIRDFKGKIIYYESSRGCPFSCAYCLSGNNSRVSYLDIKRVKKELLFFVENNVPLVKFVDRTFNADKERAKEIFAFLINNAKNTLFHFEMAGSLIDDETIQILKTAPKGLF